MVRCVVKFIYNKRDNDIFNFDANCLMWMPLSATFMCGNNVYRQTEIVEGFSNSEMIAWKLALEVH